MSLQNGIEILLLQLFQLQKIIKEETQKTKMYFITLKGYKKKDTAFKKSKDKVFLFVRLRLKKNVSHNVAFKKQKVSLL